MHLNGREACKCIYFVSDLTDPVFLQGKILQ